MPNGRLVLQARGQLVACWELVAPRHQYHLVTHHRREQVAHSRQTHHRREQAAHTRQLMAHCHWHLVAYCRQHLWPTHQQRWAKQGSSASSVGDRQWSSSRS